MRILLAILVLLACTACATGPVRPISEEERCARFSGVWQAGTCKPNA